MPASPSPYVSQTVFGFTGEETDSNGLVNLRARYYNPAIGQFFSLDPLEGNMGRPLSLDRYVYVQGNAVNHTDPSGLQDAQGVIQEIEECLNGETGICSYAVQQAEALLDELAEAYGPDNPIGDAAMGASVALRIAVAGVGLGVQAVGALKLALDLIKGLVDQNSNSFTSTSGPGVNPYAAVTSAPLQQKQAIQINQQTCLRNDIDQSKKQVLILGESNDFAYALAVASTHHNWSISATKYGSGQNNQFIIPFGAAPITGLNNITFVDNVDGRKLGEGSYTGTKKFNDIVFNAPRADAPPRPPGPHRDLVIDVLVSSKAVLSPQGIVHVSSSTGMPAGFYLQGLPTQNIKSELPPGYSFVGGKGAPTKGRLSYPFLSDPDFGQPTYVPRNNDGIPLGIPLSEIYWYYFQLL